MNFGKDLLIQYEIKICQRDGVVMALWKFLLLCFAIQSYHVAFAKEKVSAHKKAVDANKNKQTLHEVFLKQGYRAVLLKIQEQIALADGLQNNPPTPVKQPKIIDTKKKSLTKRKAVALEKDVKKSVQKQASLINKSDLHSTITKIASIIPAYENQASAVKGDAPELFDLAEEVVVDVVRISLLDKQQQDDIIKNVLPKLKTRPFNPDEDAAWISIRSIVGSYTQQNGVAVQLHPLQDIAVKALNAQLMLFKGKPIHPVLARRFVLAVNKVAAAIAHPNKDMLLPKLASLEQIQQLQSIVLEHEALPSMTKDIFKIGAESLINTLSAMRALTSVLAKQLFDDTKAQLPVRMASAMQYMNRCDSLFKKMNGISFDAYDLPDIQTLRNSFAKNLVEFFQKKSSLDQGQLLLLLQRASETGLLGKAQRSYVRTHMLPQ